MRKNYIGHNCIILIIINLNIINGYNNGHYDSDICSHWNGRRHFLELGERGELHSFNVSTLHSIRNSLYTPVNMNDTSFWYQCNLELVTCAECVIRITFTYTNFTKICNKPRLNIGNHISKCPCETIHFSEPPYDTGLSGQYFCGDGKVYRSRTRTLLLKFSYRLIHRHIFSLQYFAERNVKIVSGTPSQHIVSSSSQNFPQIISTPFFPIPYPKDYGVEHILTCDSDNCRVRLDFTDFQLGLTSTIEIFDSNGQMLGTYNGEHFRPPIVISTGKSLLIQFRGNGVSSLGYKAEVTFISEKQLKQRENLPYTDCGGIVQGLGGAITMMNMIENSTEVRYFDCIWIIKPSTSYMLMKTHILLRVDTFYGMASRSELLIRQGTTSDMLKIETINWPNNGMSTENHIIPIMSGYYIRLKGVFGLSSRLAIVYSVFNYMNCYIGSEFLCQNNHCITIRLHCDGFDHCGDKSDEPESCDENWDIPNDHRWYSHKPNYYFPKIEQYPDLKTATGIFIVSTLGILIVLSGWMVILYKMGVRARNQRELQNHLQTISELLDRQEDLSPDDPPDYEAPPDYEEVIKIGMNEQMNVAHNQSKRDNRKTRNHRSRSRNSSCTRDNKMAESLSQTYAIDPNEPCSSNSLECNLVEMEQQQEVSTQHYTPSNYLCEKERQITDSSDNQLLPNTHIQRNSCYSLGFDEYSDEFKDNSLDVSLSLSISKTPSREADLFHLQNQLLSENIHINANQMKLHQTLPISKTFLADSFSTHAVNYGLNFKSDRFLFGSDISNDLSQNLQHWNKNSSYKYKKVDSNNCDNRNVTDISCFGHVNIFSGNKRKKGYTRSKSFNHSYSRTDFKMVPLKRSSSADFLLITPQ